MASMIIVTVRIKLTLHSVNKQFQDSILNATCNVKSCYPLRNHVKQLR